MVSGTSVGVRSDRIKTAWALRSTAPRAADPLDPCVESLEAALRGAVDGCVEVALLLRDGDRLRQRRPGPGAPLRIGDGVEGAAASLRSFVWDLAPQDSALRRLGARAVAAAPVLSGDEVAGVVRVASTNEDAFEGAVSGRVFALTSAASAELAELIARRALTRAARRAESLARIAGVLLDEPLDAACWAVAAAVAEALEAPYVTISEHIAPRAWVPRAVVGWPACNVGEVFETDTARYQATYTLTLGRAVISDDLAEEDRFDATNLMLIASARSSASAPIPLGGGAAYGALVVHARELYAFTSDDLVFLERACVLLGGAAARSRADTARAEADRLRREAEARHDAALARRDEALAVAAHELRAPLSALASTLGGMRDRGEGARESFERAERQLAMLGALCNDVLDAAALDAGGLRVLRAPLDLREVIAPAMELAAPLLSARRQRVVYAPPGVAHTVLGDAGRLTQVVANLLANASKFSPAGERVELILTTEGDDHLLRVRDHGDGVDASLLPLVFEPFTQGAGAGGRGVGLGLAIVRRVVRLHDGSVEARSEGVGRGSEFTVRLPREGSRRGPRVLLVDDDDDAREALTVFLRANGCEVRGARDGAGAMRGVDDFDPALVLLDIALGDESGVEVARRIQRARPGLPLVALTGYDILPGEGAGAVFRAHLVKPVDLDRLCATIRALTTPAEHTAV